MSSDQKIISRQNITQELQKRSPMAALSHTILVGIALLTTELNDTRSPSYYFGLVIIILNFCRYLTSRSRTLLKNPNWHSYYTVFNLVNALLWFGFLYFIFDHYGLNSPMAIVTFFALGGIISASLFSLGPSLLDYCIFSFITGIAPLVYIYMSGQMKGPFLGISLMVVLFGGFILRQREILYKDWTRLFLYHQEVQEIIDTFPGTISIVRNGNYSMISSRTARVTGVNPQNFIGQKVGSQNPDTDFARTLIEFMESGREELTREIDFKMPTGERKFLLSLARIHSKPNEFIVFMLDIQDHKDAQKQIELQKASLQASAKMAALGEMSIGLAHEINNPLTIIVGRAQQLIDRTKAGEIISSAVARPIIERILATCERMTNIISGLRGISREANNDPFIETQIKDLMTKTLAFCDERLKQSSILLKVKEIDPSLSIECRPTQISQVLLNVLNNAHDAICELPEKWIEIEIKDKSEKVIIYITDSGHGIPEKVREKIMVPFFTTKEVGKGTGLGLSLSREMIESHNGKFYFDYKNPHTRVVIELPKKQIKSNPSVD